MAVKPLRALVLLILISLIWAGCSTHTQRKNPIRLSFPEYPPIPDVDPSVRHEVAVKIPTKLIVERGESTLSVAVDLKSLEDTIITVGEKMVTGVKFDLSVFSEDHSQHLHAGRYGLSSGLNFNLGTGILNTKQDGIPRAGEKYIVEMALSIFETDIPAQHIWMPGGKNYRILWKGTLRQLVE